MTDLSLLPPSQDVELYSGDDQRIRVEVYEADGTTPADITGATIASQVRLNADDDTVALTATVEPVDLTLGTFDLVFTGGDLATLLAGRVQWRGVWDCEYELGGTPRTVVRGAFTIVSDVTR